MSGGGGGGAGCGGWVLVANESTLLIVPYQNAMEMQTPFTYLWTDGCRLSSY